VIGLRLDGARFYDGAQRVVNPTKATGFSESFDEDFDKNNWFAFSPKASLEYAFDPSNRVYVSVSRGFKPPKNKDLSQSGKINKGFRLANPELKPEYLTNYEIGYRHLQNERLIIGTAVYYSLGHDFQYSVSTGDSVDTGGTSLKPVLISENIGHVKIAGFEISASYFVTRQLSVQLSYAFNYSIISEYHPSLADPSADLSGKKMAEVSPHTAYAGLDWKNRYFNFQINGNYVDQQWYDPENTILVDDYFLLNAKISRVFHKHYQLAFDAQNILDNQFVDRKGELAPGRYMTFTFTYKF
jgi:iron complex outermembrane receptor protein